MSLFDSVGKKCPLFGLAALLAASLIISGSGVFAGNQPAAAVDSRAVQKNHVAERVRASIQVKAPPAVLWATVLDFTRHDPEVTYFKPLGHEGDVNTIEEGVNFPTLFGSAECKLHFTETPPQRVDFYMLESEDLKAMEGSWVVSRAENAKDSILELSSYVDPNMMIPRPIVNAIIQHRIDTRVMKVKRMAEQGGSHVLESQSSPVTTR